MFFVEIDGLLLNYIVDVIIDKNNRVMIYYSFWICVNLFVFGFNESENYRWLLKRFWWLFLFNIRLIGIVFEVSGDNLIYVL